MRYLLILLLFFLTSCISNIQKHGYMFDLVDQTYLTPGVTSKNRLLNIMGSASYISYLGDEEVWLYFYEKTNRILFFKPKILERKILLVSFDDDVISKMRQFDLSNENDKFKFSQKFSEVETEDEGFFKALFGNVGQVSAQ